MRAISEKLRNGFNKQITAEFESAYLYLDMANYLEAQNLNGMARWFRLQAEEEKKHAVKINDFLIEREISPDLAEIKAPSVEWIDVPSILDAAYRHECLVSDLIYDLVAQAMEDKDFSSLSFLQWFVDEQVEEESQSLFFSNKARLVADNIGGLMVLDREMGERQD